MRKHIFSCGLGIKWACTHTDARTAGVWLSAQGAELLLPFPRLVLSAAVAKHYSAVVAQPGKRSLDLPPALVPPEVLMVLCLSLCGYRRYFLDHIIELIDEVIQTAGRPESLN